MRQAKSSRNAIGVLIGAHYPLSGIEGNGFSSADQDFAILAPQDDTLADKQKSLQEKRAEQAALANYGNRVWRGQAADFEPKLRSLLAEYARAYGFYSTKYDKEIAYIVQAVKTCAAVSKAQLESGAYNGHICHDVLNISQLTGSDSSFGKPDLYFSSGYTAANGDYEGFYCAHISDCSKDNNGD